MREEKARNRVCHECTRTNTSQSSLHFNTSNNKHKQTFWHTRGWEKECLWIPVSQDTSRSSKVFLSGFFSLQRNLSSLAPLIPKGCSVCCVHSSQCMCGSTEQNLLPGVKKGNTCYLHKRSHMLPWSYDIFCMDTSSSLRWGTKLNFTVSLHSKQCARISGNQQLLLPNMLLRIGKFI